uniref:ERG24 reductase n=1 Tax=Macrostomum lignano TaxID=282301 RepID=A0A1I8IG86_9PLAT
ALPAPPSANGTAEACRVAADALGGGARSWLPWLVSRAWGLFFVAMGNKLCSHGKDVAGHAGPRPRMGEHGWQPRKDTHLL